MLVCKRELARQLGVSARTLDRMRRAGMLSAVRLGLGKVKPRVLFDVERVKAALEALREGASPCAVAESGYNRGPASA